MAPTLAIVIVNWNALADLQLCVASLAVQRDAIFEVIVVDNGSTDGSRAWLRSQAHLDVIESDENLGFAAACNLGIQRATADWVLTLNNDTVVSGYCIRTLLEHAAKAPADVGMLQPRLVLRGRDRLNSTGVLVHRDGSANDRDFDAPTSQRRTGDEILCVTAGAGLYRRAMLDSVTLPSGVFDPGYFMYFEDVDLGWRSRLAGWRAMYVPDAVVEHAFQASSKRRGRHFVTIQCMRNRVRTLLKNGSWRLVVRSLPRTASDFLWLMQHGGGRALSSWIGAARDAIGQRHAVTSLLKEKRRTLEARWMRTEPGTTLGLPPSTD